MGLMLLCFVLYLVLLSKYPIVKVILDVLEAGSCSSPAWQPISSAGSDISVEIETAGTFSLFHKTYTTSMKGMRAK